MKILFITNYYPPHEVGGYEQLCRDVVERLRARGHATAVLTSDRGAGSEDTSAQPGIRRLLRIQPQYRKRPGVAWQFFVTRRGTEATNRRCFSSVAAEICPDVVFIWNLEGLPHELALDAEALPGVAVAYWLAGCSPAEPDLFWRYWTQPPAKHAFLAGVKRMLCSAALAKMRREGKPVRPLMRHVGVVSEYVLRKGWAEQTLPGSAQVIYNGVETESFYRQVPSPLAGGPVRLLLAGRVSRAKGTHVALEAVGRLARDRVHHDFQLVVAGNGPADYLENLRQLVESNDTRDVVTFLGWLPRERMPELMHTCHILLAPTIYQEPFARVTLEAMAAGLAVVGTVTGGTGELLEDGHTGLVCKPGDSEDLARQIGRLLDDPQLRSRLARSGQKKVLADYTLERMVDHLEALLQRAVQEAREEGNPDAVSG